MPILPFVQNPYSAPVPYGRPVQAPIWQQAPGQRMQVPAALAEQAAPRPKIRMQAPEALTVAARLSLPSPEQLGISSITRPAPPQDAVDWNQVRTRLNRLGALGFHLDKLSHGGTRVRFFLPTGQSQSTHHVEAAADTEAAALHLALDRAEIWARSRK